VDPTFKIPVPRQHSNSYEVSLWNAREKCGHEEKRLPVLLFSDHPQQVSAAHSPVMSPAMGTRVDNSVPVRDILYQKQQRYVQ
jgi:hypothetical protein